MLLQARQRSAWQNVDLGRITTKIACKEQSLCSVGGGGTHVSLSVFLRFFFGPISPCVVGGELKTFLVVASFAETECMAHKKIHIQVH